MKILSLDPSINNVGYAVLDGKAKTKESAWLWGTIYPQGNNLQMRIMDLIQHLSIEVGPFDLLVTEKPAFFSSERGQIAAHMNYTIDLAAINYSVAGWFHKDHRQHFAITATQWKGMVSKAITAKRFFRRFPEVTASNISEHAIDAVMLLRFAVEEFICRLPKEKLGVSPEHLLSLT